MKKLFIGLIIILLYTAIICGWLWYTAGIPTQIGDDASVSVWAANWGITSGEQDVSALAENGFSGDIVYFAGYFDENDNPAVFDTDGAGAAFKSYKTDISDIYLTFVNDIVDKDGKAIKSKDSELLVRLLENHEKRTELADKIASLTTSGGYDGAEIDFEKIPSEQTENYFSFLTELKQRLNGLELRAILESSFDIETPLMPSGISYSIMAYNLYGNHSGPGPKADKKFIRRLAAKIHDVDNFGLSFATGGFDWNKNEEKPKALTETDAETLASKIGAKPSRDRSSAALSFKYTDENDNPHEVWYADGTTFEFWLGWAYEKGVRDFSIWRAGGMSSSTTDFLAGL